MPSPALQQPTHMTTHMPKHKPGRQHYRPQADRLPRWLHRVWAWF
jgi:hypothetical protein